MDDEGFVKIVGRSKDMIIRGGENIYPREVEEFLYSHSKIKMTSRLSAFRMNSTERKSWHGVVLKDGVDAEGSELQAYCQDKIAHYKIPRYWRFTDSFPMTVTGKIQKFKMREISVKKSN